MCWCGATSQTSEESSSRSSSKGTNVGVEVQELWYGDGLLVLGIRSAQPYFFLSAVLFLKPNMKHGFKSVFCSLHFNVKTPQTNRYMLCYIYLILWRALSVEVWGGGMCINIRRRRLTLITLQIVYLSKFSVSRPAAVTLKTCITTCILKPEM
jgi:hypothetical protein